MRIASANNPLQPEVMSPPPSARFLPIAAALALLAGLAATGLSWMLAFGLPRASRITVSIEHIPPAPPSTQPSPNDTAVSVLSPSSQAELPAVEPRHGEYALTFSLGSQVYAAIDRIDIPDTYYEASEEPDIETFLPAHGPYVVFFNGDTTDGLVASLDRVAAPGDVAAWLGREVIIHDGGDGRCVATVEDIALVGLMSGSYDEMYDDSGERSSPSEQVRRMVEGSALYLAARLAGCPSERGVARLASLSAPVSATVHTDKELVARGKSRLFASEYATQAQQAYIEAGHRGRFYRDRYADIASQVFSHPGTGQRFVSIHVVVDYGCGGANINLWALYRVSESGELVEMRVLDSLDLGAVSHPIDLDGDGLFEFPSRSVYGDSSILAMDGTPLRTLEVPFYGCPC